MPVWDVLRRRHVTRLLGGTLLGRLPNGMAVVTFSLVMRAAGADFALVSAATATYAVGTAVGGPALGRIVDRIGQTRPLAVTGVLSAVGFGVAALAPTPPVVLVAAGVAGLTTPPLEPALRALWPDVTEPEQLESAYAIDTGSQELVFITGPLVVAACAVTAGPTAALWVCAAAGLLGVAVVATCPPSRRWRAPARSGDLWGPLRDARLRLVLLVTATLGASIGALNIAVVALGEASAVPGLAGLLLAANAVGALIGSVVYAGRRWRVPPAVRAAGTLVGAAASYVLLAAVAGPGGPVAIWFLAVALAGGFFAAALAVALALVPSLAPAGTVTEAFAWVVTVFTLGTSAGSAVAGGAVTVGAASSLGPSLVAAGVLVAGAIVAGLARRALSPAPR